MKKIIIAILSLLILAFASCTKEETKPTELSLSGTWYANKYLTGDTYTYNLSDSTYIIKSTNKIITQRVYLMSLSRININSVVYKYEFDQHNLLLGNQEYFR